MCGFRLLVGSSTRSASLKMFSKSHRFRYAISRYFPLLLRILLARKYFLSCLSRAPCTVSKNLLFVLLSFIQYWNCVAPAAILFLFSFFLIGVRMMYLAWR